MSSETTCPVPAAADDPASGSRAGLGVLSGLWPFVSPYRLALLFTALFMALAALGTLLAPLELGRLVDQGLVAADPGQRVMALRSHFLLLLAVGVAVGIFSAARYYSVGWLGERVTADLRARAYANVLRQSPQFFETTKIGEVLSRLNADTTLVQTVVGSSLSIGLRNAVIAFGACLMLLWTTPVIMLQVMALVVFVMLPAMAVDRYVLRLARNSQQRLADATSIAVEVLAAMPVVQSFNQEAREAQRYAQASEATFHAARRHMRARAPLMAFSIAVIVASLLWGLYQGVQQVLHGTMTPGQLSQTVIYIVILLGSLAALIEVWGELQRAASATQRLMELLNVSPRVISSQGPAVAGRQAQTGSHGVHLVFERLHFAYPSRPGAPALIDFSLDVPPGQTVALVGPSGAGKSTLFQLLLRFYDPQSGCIRLDGTPLTDIDLHALRERVSIVPQDSVVFSGTLMDNIRYGRPHASDAQTQAAARAAHVDEFVRQLPQGYDTQVGERGLRLSGGQRQRIAIARAMLKDAPLLLLDEATSALDTQSERAVQDALHAAMRGRTTLIIAHRLSTVVGADRIVVMDHGRAVDSGTHTELLERCELYAALARAQLGAGPGLPPRRNSPDV